LALFLLLKLKTRLPMTLSLSLSILQCLSASFFECIGLNQHSLKTKIKLYITTDALIFPLHAQLLICALKLPTTADTYVCHPKLLCPTLIVSSGMLLTTTSMTTTATDAAVVMMMMLKSELQILKA